MSYGNNELIVITKAKDLCSYIMVVTQKSPKHFRYTFVSRLQNLALSIVENLYRANYERLILEHSKEKNLRLKYQKDAFIDLKLLGYISLLAMEQQCILPKQYKQISLKLTECLSVLAGWIKSDKKRLGIA